MLKGELKSCSSVELLLCIEDLQINRIQTQNLEDKVAPSTGVEKGNAAQVIYAAKTARQVLSHVLSQHCHP